MADEYTENLGGEKENIYQHTLTCGRTFRICVCDHTTSESGAAHYRIERME